MRALLRVSLFIAVCSILIGAGAGVVQAQAHPSMPQLPGATCEDGAQTPGGAQYRICLPFTWTPGQSDLLVYAHGYVAPNRPIGLPDEQFTIGGVPIADLITLQGYAFAASSYSVNGLAIQQGIGDTVQLVDLFKTKYGQPRRVLLAGVSEGGAIAVLALERRPDVFAGGLAMCGPYGNFQAQIDHFSNFRAVFDFYFPGLLPPTPVDIPSYLIDQNDPRNWDTHYYSETVKPVLVAPGSQFSVTQVVSVTGTPVGSAGFPTGAEPTFERLLWYNVFSTNDGTQKLGGNPFGNQTVHYSGSSDDDALNQGVFRVTADVTATQAVASGYETSGRLNVPLVILHTTGDPVVPYAQAVAYGDKVKAAGTQAYYQQFAVAAYGHCAFAQADVLNAFAALTARLDIPNIYVPLVTRSP